jgi:hypothetical protein
VDDPVASLQIRVVGGSVNVVGTTSPTTRVEVSELKGPPLHITRTGDELTIAYEDVPWQGFLKWLDRKGWNRHAVVSVSVPADVRLSVAVVGASAFVSGITGRTDVRGVSGDTTLVGVAGPVRAETVSGNVEAQGITGSVGFNSVSGDLTIIDGRSPVRADSVSGSMILDLDTAAGETATDIALGTVSGELALRLSSPVDATVEASTAGGGVSSAFDELTVEGMWGAKTVKGSLGTGAGRLRANSVSGSIALLQRAEPLHDDDLLLTKDA